MSDPPHAPATRERILRAAVDLLQRGKAPSMAAIARTAGVSRQTLYLHFGDRVGLFADVIPFLAADDPVLPRMEDALALPAREAFDRHFREWIAVAARMAPHFTPLSAAMARDVAIVRGVRERDKAVRDIYVRLFEKVARAGLLKPSWAVAEAADAAWSMSLYLFTLGHMRLMRGWSVEEIAERQLKLLREAFLVG